MAFGRGRKLGKPQRMVYKVPVTVGPATATAATGRRRRKKSGGRKRKK